MFDKKGCSQNSVFIELLVIHAKHFRIFIRSSFINRYYFSAMRINCQAYHSGLNIFERTEALDNFMNDKVKIIVATTAFGLGVHKSDVRLVLK